MASLMKDDPSTAKGAPIELLPFRSRLSVLYLSVAATGDSCCQQGPAPSDCAAAQNSRASGLPNSRSVRDDSRHHGRND
jgi:hypothetical protein